MQDWVAVLGVVAERVQDAWTDSLPRVPSWMWAVVVLVAFVASRSRRVQTWLTLLHEAGHAVVALATGNRLRSLHINGDGSGHVVTVGGGRIRRVAVSAAGYPAPAWLGAALLTAVVAGRFGAAVVVAGAVALLLLAWARTWRAALALLVVAGAAAAFVWWPPSVSVTRTAALAVAALALAAMLGSFGDLLVERQARRLGAHTDVVALERATSIPAALWWAFLGLLCLAAALPVAFAAGVLPAGVA